MPSVSELENSNKPPLGAALAAGVKALSVDQQISFSLYRKYVFPLDGMNYWIRIPSATGSVQTAGVELTPGLAFQTAQSGEAIQVAPGGVGALDTIGGIIQNPRNATDQGLPYAENLFVDFTGPAYSYETGTTTLLLPGDTIDIPPGSAAWVNAATKGHQFTVVIQTSVSSVTMPTDVQVQGSFHYDSTINQDEDAVFDSNTVIFTALQEIQPFNQIGPDYLYIGHYNNLTFAFNHRARLYEQADLYHYKGQSLRTRHASMIIDDPTQFNPTLTVSNSLPIWLNMPNYVPPYPGFTCDIPLFPSYLVTDNLPPPFGSVHIEKTESLEMGSAYGPHLEQDQFCREVVRVHLYGCDNLTASNFLSFVEQYSRDWMNLGLSHVPAIKDVKLPQAEFKILAQYKTIEFEINYRQQVIRNEARQFIEHVIVQWIPEWLIQTKYVGNAAGYSSASAFSNFGKGSAVGRGAASGIGRSTVIAQGSTVGAGVASGIGLSVKTSLGSAAGTGVALGRSQSIGVAAGIGAVSGVGRVLNVFPGSAAGIGSASGVGRLTVASQGSTAGTGTALGASLIAVRGSASSSSLALGIAQIMGRAIGTGFAAAIALFTGFSAGIGAATGIGQSSSQGSAVGTGTASAVSIVTTTSRGSAAGIGAVSAVAAGKGTATGTGAASAVGQTASRGSSVGTGAASATAANTGTSTGTSTASAVGQSRSQGSAAGTGAVSGVGQSIALAQGSLIGAGTASATQLAVKGSASGIGVASGTH